MKNKKYSKAKQKYWTRRLVEAASLSDLDMMVEAEDKLDKYRVRSIVVENEE